MPVQLDPFRGTPTLPVVEAVPSSHRPAHRPRPHVGRISRGAGCIPPAAP